jgi:translation initiation factor IF-1
VEEVLPRALYRVRLDAGPTIRAGVDAISQGRLVRLIAGDRVWVRRVARDPGRGQIVRKL